MSDTLGSSQRRDGGQTSQRSRSPPACPACRWPSKLSSSIRCRKGFTLLYCAVTHLPQMSWYSWTMLEVTMLWSNTSSSQEHSVPSYQGLEVSDPSNLRMWRCSLCSFHLPDLLWPPYTCQPALSSRCTRMAARGTRPSEGCSEGLAYKKCVIDGYIARIVTFMRKK